VRTLDAIHLSALEFMPEDAVTLCQSLEGRLSDRG
jgi:hypothetical protein